MLFKIKSIVTLVAFLLVIIGCGGGSSSSPDVTPTPTPVVIPTLPPVVTPAPTPVPTPIPTNPVITTGSIVIMGLGDTILVTDQSTVTISGVAESNVGIKHIEFLNDTTGVSGTATGTENWSAQIVLNQGDNKLIFTAVFNDNSKMDISTVLTYYPGLKFTSALTLSEKVLYKNEAKDITFTIGINKEAAQNVKLYEANEDGTIISEKTELLDDGTLPDEIEKDGIFTAKVNVNSNTEGKLCYRAGVLSGTTVDYYSETQCALVTEHYSSANISSAVKLADDTKSAYDQELAGGATHNNAMQFAADSLINNPDIGIHGYAKDSGIWWISNVGILGGFHPTLAGQRSASGETQARGEAKPIVNTTSKQVLTYYPTSYVNSDNTLNAPMQANASAASSNKNFIHSNKALIISPYINNPNTTSNFGNTDDYFGPWKTIQDEKSCQLYAAKEVVNNGSVNVTLSTFITNSDYGYIHVCTHGDNFYNGLFSLWDNQWGDKTALGGALSQVVLFTGLKLPTKADGTLDITGYENLLKSKYIALFPGGSIVFLPAFIRDFGQNLPNSIVVLAACRSMYNNSLANAYLSKGASAAIGYTDYVGSTYAQNTTKTIVEELYKGKTVKEAVNEAIKLHGANDGSAEPAYLVMTGNLDVALSGKLQNGGFEEGSLTPWSKTGDGRVITQLGATSPTEGNYMGIVSTGLGYTTTSGSIEQDFCLTANATQLTFNWNFFSEEFLEYCSSVYQDAFSVEMCEVDLDNNGSTKGCTTLLYKDVDSLCGSVTQSDIGFDQGDVHDTGWQNKSVDISAYAGKAVRLKFFATDVGDSIYDTAILIDDIKIVETTP